jgi:hypothetical protein
VPGAGGRGRPSSLMLAQLFPPTNDFAALAAYFINGRERPPNPERVAWVFAQNLPTDDPLLAAKMMAATAELSKRCRDACLHTVIAWHKDERPTPEMMQEIARRTLAMAELDEHQAFVMEHGDRDHPHLHIMLNRVHPETGKAYDLYRSHLKFDRIMKQLADEYSFRYVPPHAFEPELTDAQSKGPSPKAHRAAQRGANTARPQWPKQRSRRYGARLSEHLSHATSWDDVEYLLAEDGLTLDAKGKGLVVGNKQGYSKFSALGLNLTAKGFEKKFRKKFVPPSKRPRPPTRHPGRSIWSVDAIDIARVLGTREQLRAAINEATGQRKARRARLPLLRQLMEELKEQWKAGTALANIEKAKSGRANPSKTRRSGKAKAAGRGGL